MSDMISYNVSIDPSPTEIDVTAAVENGNRIKVTVSSVPSVTFHLSPSGNWAEKILSGVAWPVATLIASFCKDKPKEMLEGQEVVTFDIPTYTAKGIAVAASSVTMGSATFGTASMLKVTAALLLSATSSSSGGKK